VFFLGHIFNNNPWIYNKMEKETAIIYSFGLGVSWLVCFIIKDYFISGIVIFLAMLIQGLICYHTNKEVKN